MFRPKMSKLLSSLVVLCMLCMLAKSAEGRLNVQMLDKYYMRQGRESTVLYKEEGFRFLQLSRWDTAEEMLGFLSVFDASVDSPAPTTFLQNLPYSFLLVLKFADDKAGTQKVRICSPKCYTITVDTTEGTEVMLDGWFEAKSKLRLQTIEEDNVITVTPEPNTEETAESEDTEEITQPRITTKTTPRKPTRKTIRPKPTKKTSKPKPTKKTPKPKPTKKTAKPRPPKKADKRKPRKKIAGRNMITEESYDAFQEEEDDFEDGDGISTASEDGEEDITTAVEDGQDISTVFEDGEKNISTVGVLSEVVVRSANVASIIDSYVIFCYSFNDHLGECHPRLLGAYNRTVRCECLNSSGIAGYLLVVIFIIILFALIIASLLCQSRRKLQVPEVQYNAQLCMPAQTSYEYVVILRVGPVVDNMAFDTAYVDFQLFSHNGDDGHLGVPCRFSCQPIGDNMFTEMSMIIGRLTQLPPVVSVSAQHSERGRLLFFYGLSIVNLADNRVIQNEKIGQYIGQDLRRFPLGGQDGQGADTRYQEYEPQLVSFLLGRLDSYEMIEVILGAVALITSFTMLVLQATGVHTDYYHWRKTTVLLGAIGAGSCVLSLTIVCLVEVCNRLYFKKKYLTQRYRIFTRRVSKPRIMRERVLYKFFHWLVNLTSLCLLGLVIYFSIDLPFPVVALWLGLSLTSLSVTLSIWYLVQWADCTKEGCDYRYCVCWPFKTEELMINQMASECGNGSVNIEDINNLPVLNLVTSVPSWSGEPKFENPRGNNNNTNPASKTESTLPQASSKVGGKSVKYEKFMANRRLRSKDTEDTVDGASPKDKTKVDKAKGDKAKETANNKADKAPKLKKSSSSPTLSNTGSQLSRNSSTGAGRGKSKVNQPSPTDPKQQQQQQQQHGKVKTKDAASKLGPASTNAPEPNTLRTNSDRKRVKSTTGSPKSNATASTVRKG